MAIMTVPTYMPNTYRSMSNKYKQHLYNMEAFQIAGIQVSSLLSCLSMDYVSMTLRPVPFSKY